ncbi:MAG: rubredoxin [Magnetococcus sp. YQC-5]
MTTSLEKLITRAIDLGLKSTLATPKAASLLAGNNKSAEALATIQDSNQLTAEYKACLKEIELAAPQQYASLRNQIVDQVRKAMKKQPGMRKWRCKVCSFLYDEKIGLPKGNIPPATSFQNLPSDWECPDCDVGKDQFVLDQD